MERPAHRHLGPFRSRGVTNRAAAAAGVAAAGIVVASIFLVASGTLFSPTPTRSSPPPLVSSSQTPTPALPSPSPAPSPIPTPTATPGPTPPPSLYVWILEGDQYGNVRAQTEAGATCSMRAILPDGSDAPGIRNPQTARPDGIVAWIYSQLPTDEGMGMHTVSCTLNGLSGTAWVYFEVGG